METTTLTMFNDNQHNDHSDYRSVASHIVRQQTNVIPAIGSLDTRRLSAHEILQFETRIIHHIAPDSHCGKAPPRQPDLELYTSPLGWSTTRKNGTLILGMFAAALASHAAGSYSSIMPQLESEWGISEFAAAFGITMFTTGFSLAPMLLAPVSEARGRYWIFIGAGTLFVIGQICCALTSNLGGMLVARFWTGVGGSVFSSMVGGVIGDIYEKEDRNTPMALFSAGALFGTGTGPLCSGFITTRLTWRWVFWVQAIANGILVLAFTIFYRETRGDTLLSHKARSLNCWYEALEGTGFIYRVEYINSNGFQKSSHGKHRWLSDNSLKTQSFMRMLGTSVTQPFYMLFTEPVLFVFSLWVSFAWAVLYMTFGSIPIVYGKNFGFNVEENGAVFTSMCTGVLIATALELWQQKLLPHFAKDSIAASPESRLFFACVEGALLPIGLFWFAWTQFPSFHWIVPTLSIGCASMGIYWVYLAVFNYLVDCYGIHASSALAAQSFCRNMIGGAFPLVTPALFRNLGFAAAASLLGGIATLLALVPWVLVCCGPYIRARSKYII